MEKRKINIEDLLATTNDYKKVTVEPIGELTIKKLSVRELSSFFAAAQKTSSSYKTIDNIKTELEAKGIDTVGFNDEGIIKLGTENEVESATSNILDLAVDSADLMAVLVQMAYVEFSDLKAVDIAKIKLDVLTSLFEEAQDYNGIAVGEEDVESFREGKSVL